MMRSLRLHDYQTTTVSGAAAFEQGRTDGDVCQSDFDWEDLEVDLAICPDCGLRAVTVTDDDDGTLDTDALDDSPTLYECGACGWEQS